MCKTFHFGRFSNEALWSSVKHKGTWTYKHLVLFLFQIVNDFSKLDFQDSNHIHLPTHTHISQTNNESIQSIWWNLNWILTLLECFTWDVTADMDARFFYASVDISQSEQEHCRSLVYIFYPSAIDIPSNIYLVYGCCQLRLLFFLKDRDEKKAPNQMRNSDDCR